MSIIDLRYAKLGTREELNADNIVLAFMQPGIEKDTGDTKLGDGRTRYRDLAYFTGSMTRTYRGEVASEVAMLGLEANISDWCTRTDDGNRNYELTALPPNKAANWTSYISGTIANGVSQAEMTSAIATAKAEAQDRSKGTNNDPAGNVVFASDSLTLEQWRISVESRLASGGTSDPVVTTDPSLGGTVGVGNALTITKGTVTNGSGGAHVDTWTWFFVRTGVVSQVYTETIASAATPSTFVQTAAHIGGSIYVTQKATDTVTNKPSNTRTSNVKGPVTGTAPTNTGTAPSISVSAPSGSAITVSVGVWTGATNYVVQLYADGVPYKTASAKASSTSVAMGNSDDTVVGKALTARVTGYSALDVPSTAPGVLTSNSVTVTGTTPAVTNTSPVAWPATINFGTAANLTIGTYSAPVHATRVYEFYIGVPDSSPDYTPQALPIHTPRSPAVVGNTLYVIERVYDVATGLTEVANSVSAGKVISAAIATFAAALTAEGAAGYSWTQSSPISQATIATLSGGTQPWLLDPTTPFSPAMASGITVSISGANVIGTGNPSVVSSSTPYTVNFKDSAGTPASASITFNASVAAAAGVTALSAWTAASTITNGGGAITSVTDPLGTGRTLEKHRAPNSAYPSNREVRAEKYATSGAGSSLAPATDYWFAFGVSMDPTEKVPTSSSSDDDMLVLQTHTPAQGDTQPDISLHLRGQSNTQRWIVAYNSRPPSDWNYNGGLYPDTEGTTTLHTETLMAVSTRYRYIVHYRPGYTSGHSPVFEVWRSINGAAFAKLFTHTGLNTYNTTGSGYGYSYLRKGIYKWSSSFWDSAALSFYMTPIYFGTGTNLYSEAEAALVGW